GAVKVKNKNSLFSSFFKYCMRILIFSAFLRAFFHVQTGQNRCSQLLERCNLVFSIVLSATINKNVLHSFTRSSVFSVTCELIKVCNSSLFIFFWVYFSRN